MGLTPQGYSPTTTDEEVSTLNGKFLANVRGDLDLSPDQPMGQVIAIFAEQFAQLTELGATVYNMLNPAAAEGQFLVNTAAITGTRPQVATYSTVTAQLTLTAGTTVHAGATASVANQPSNVWVLTADVTNSGATTTVVNGLFRSQTPGIFKANAGTLTVIGTPTTGWAAISNPLDSADGLAADTDTSLRNKRSAELAGIGSGDLDAIRAAVAEVTGVLSAFGFENDTNVLDANNLPGKSFRIVIWDGASPAASNDAVAQAIWTHKPSGILAYGATTGNAVDSQGTPRVVAFDRATQLPLYVSCTTTPSSISSAQRDAIKAAIKGFADATFGLGVSVVARLFSASPLEPVSAADATALRPAYAPVVTDVPTFTFDTHPTPTNTGNLPATGLQIYTLDAANILVNGS